MPHNLTALILKGPYDQDLAAAYDLQGLPLGFDLTLFHIHYCYTAFMERQLGISGQLAGGPPSNTTTQHVLLFPTDRVSAVLMTRITRTPPPLFAIIHTDYFGGIGDQWARVYNGEVLLENLEPRISPALEAMGVKPSPGLDAFDTIGLSKFRSSPDYLQKYIDLADTLGLFED